MSQSGDGDANIVAAQDVATVPPVVNIGSTGIPYNPFSGSRPPSIHDAASSDESSSSYDEGEMSEAKRRWKEKMKEKIEKKARKLIMMMMVDQFNLNHKCHTQESTKAFNGIIPLTTYLGVFEEG